MITDFFDGPSDYPLVVAKFDYTSRTDADLSFAKGDILCIINSDDDDWWLAGNSSNEEGYIPSSYVAEYQSLDSQK